MIVMPLSSSKRKLQVLRRKWIEQYARIGEIIKRRLEQFRRGKISSEEFEKALRAEHDFARLGKKISRFGRRERMA